MCEKVHAGTLNAVNVLQCLGAFASFAPIPLPA